MNKAQALQAFWASFTWNAYDENTVPRDAGLPYITYESATDSLGNTLSLNASLWTRDTGWETIEAKSAEIARAIAENGFYRAPIDGGYMVIWKGSPFSRRMDEPGDDLIRRILLNIQVEFLTAY